MKLPEEDPELKAQEARASAEKIDAIRERVSARTMQSMRLYGARAALAGTGKGAPILQMGVRIPSPQQIAVANIRPRPVF